MQDDVITIVSGLPRSGTSMMMRMLETGGMPVLVDHIRKADEDNPRGYYEFERVKSIKEDDTWLNAAGGKVVKMVSMLLYNLPSTRKYKVIFMRRVMTEILASQRTMLERIGQGGFKDAEMDAIFSKHLKEIQSWLADRENFEVLYVSYNEIIVNSRPYVSEINRFFGGGLNEEKMVQIVDCSLYRQRRESDRYRVCVPPPVGS